MIRPIGLLGSVPYSVAVASIAPESAVNGGVRYKVKRAVAVRKEGRPS